MPNLAPNLNVRISTRDLISLRRRAEGLRLSAREPTRSVLAGGHRSAFRGRGMDYQESRHYQPGDDIRNMDWRITARAGRPHVKVYEEEQERPVIVLVDLGPSMFFGTRGAFKSVAAARLAALVGWAAVAGGDRIGALLFNGGHHELQPAGGRRAAMRLIRDLAFAGDAQGRPSVPGDRSREGRDAQGRPSVPGDTTPGMEELEPRPEQRPRRREGRGREAGRGASSIPGGLSAALARLRRVVRPGSLVFVISDFYGMDADSGRHLGQLRRHSEVVACQIADALELAPPPPGRYGIGDGRHTGVLDTRAIAARARYADYFARHHAAVAAMTKAHGVPLIRLSPEEDPVARLTDALELRPAGRRRHGRVSGVPGPQSGGLEVAR
jgi:uncharacterized protein (DUF58 family)